ncbi:MAG: transglutaminase-like domain-containing protein [Planctomycetota bacterium]
MRRSLLGACLAAICATTAFAQDQGTHDVDGESAVDPELLDLAQRLASRGVVCLADHRDGKKVGWGSYTYEVVEHHGLAALAEKSVSLLYDPHDVIAPPRSVRSRVVHALQRPGRVLEIELRDVTGDLSYRVEATRTTLDQPMTARITGREESPVMLNQASLLASVSENQWFRSCADSEESDWRSFDYWWVSGWAPELEAQSTAHYLGSSWVVLHGVRTLVHVHDLHRLGSVATVDSVEHMLTLRITSAEGWSSRREPPSLARSMVGPTLDVFGRQGLAIANADLDTSIPATIRLRLDNLRRYEVPSTGSQEALSFDDRSAVIEVRSIARSDWRDDLSSEDQRRLTEPSDRYPTAAKSIAAALAPLGLADHSSTEDRIREITKFLGTLTPRFGGCNRDAVRVLENGCGDCIELSILFVALARAAGIPAREASGLVSYTDDPSTLRFASWVQVHDGTRFVDIDPFGANNEPIALRLLLGTGPSLKWAKRLHQLQVTQVEAGDD